MNDQKWIYEGEAIRMHQTNKRLFVLCVVLIIITFASNAGWMFYASQFETVQIEAEQQADGDSTNYLIGGDYNASKAESEGN